MGMPRVLLVEDDPSVRRFVAMALDDADIELVQRDSVEGAFGYLAAQPVDLVLTDLMLLDGSALRLVEWLAQSAACRVAVFSAGVTPEVQRRLEACRVWRILRKPVSLAQLHACVAEGTQLPAAAPATAAAESVPGVSARETYAAERYFDGNTALFSTYAAGCREQFARDVLAGDRAWLGDDLAELRRLAHSLKTVLLMLGYDHEASMARMLDEAAAVDDGQEAYRLWDLLRNALKKIASPLSVAQAA
ncbi:MAG: response regulator [Pseudomonadota bacterium]